MIRKAIIVVLTLAATGTGVTCVASLRVYTAYDGKYGEVALVAGGLWFYRQPRPPYLPQSQGFYMPQNHLYLTEHELLVIPEWSPAHRWWGTPVRSTVVGVPLWIPFVLFAAHPTLVFTRPLRRRWRDERRSQRGLCVECKYDLTGNASGVCPECGTPLTGTIEARQARTGPRHRHDILVFLLLGYIAASFVLWCYMIACDPFALFDVGPILIFHAPLATCAALTVARFAGAPLRWTALLAFTVAIAVVGLLNYLLYVAALASV